MTDIPQYRGINEVIKQGKNLAKSLIFTLGFFAQEVEAQVSYIDNYGELSKDELYEVFQSRVPELDSMKIGQKDSLSFFFSGGGEKRNEGFVVHRIRPDFGSGETSYEFLYYFHARSINVSLELKNGEEEVHEFYDVYGLHMGNIVASVVKGKQVITIYVRPTLSQWDCSVLLYYSQRLYLGNHEKPKIIKKKQVSHTAGKIFE